MKWKSKVEGKGSEGRLIASKAVTRLRVNWIFPFVPFISSPSFFFFKSKTGEGEEAANSIEVAIKSPRSNCSDSVVS